MRYPVLIRCLYTVMAALALSACSDDPVVPEDTGAPKDSTDTEVPTDSTPSDTTGGELPIVDTIAAPGAFAYRGSFPDAGYYRGRLELDPVAGRPDSLTGRLQVHYHASVEVEVDAPVSGHLQPDGRFEVVSHFRSRRLIHRGVQRGDTLFGVFVLSRADLGAEDGWTDDAMGGFHAIRDTLLVPDAMQAVLVGGEGQTGEAGAELESPLAVLVRDREGRPQAGVPVWWVLWDTTATVEPRVSVTDEDGLVRARVTLGETAGPQPGVAVVVGSPVVPLGPAAVSGAVHALAPRARPDAAVVGDAVRMLPGGTDRFGNPVPEPDVDWTVSDASVASVDSTGLLRGLSPGEVAVSARQGEIEGTVTVKVLAPPEPTRKRVTAGEAHTCALGVDGQAFCWGRNAEGVLGVGSDSPTIQEPVQVSGGHRFASLAAGRVHTCGVDLEGRLFCWGSNLEGAIGVGHWSEPALTPVHVLPDLRFVEVAASGSHTCGRTDRLTVYCWGWNGHGELGQGWFRTADMGVANFPPARVESEHAFRAISAAEARTCAAGVYGAGFCWGEAPQGDDLTNGENVALTARVELQSFLTQVEAGDRSCALTAADSVYCWGVDPTGTDGSREAPQPEPAGPDGAATAIDVSDRHACALLANAAAECWGSNDAGQLGTGSDASFAGPAPVAGGHSFVELSAAGRHTCGLDTDARLWCWGSDEHGQLGNGASGGDSRVPVRVTGF